ncbi:response regulator [Rhizobium sp. PAMB 3182]
MTEAGADLVLLACERIRAHELPAYVKDGKLRFSAVNDAFARLFGLTADSFEGRLASDLGIAGVTGELEERERRALVFGSEETAAWFDASGNTRHSVLIERFISDSGQFHVVGIFEEQTEVPSAGPVAATDASGPGAGTPGKPPDHGLAPAGDQHSFGQDLFKELLDKLPVATFVRGRDHRLIAANRHYARIVGMPEDKLIGTTQPDIFGPVGLEYQAADEVVLETGSTAEFQQTALLPDGEEHVLLCRITRVSTAAAGSFLVGTITDVTELKQREAQLIAERAKTESLRGDLERLVSAMPVGVVMMSSDFVVEYVNQEARNIWGWPDDAVIEGMGFSEVVELTRQGGMAPVKTEALDEYVDRRRTELADNSFDKPQEVEYENGKFVVVSNRHLSDGRLLMIYTDVTTIRSREMEIDQVQEQLSRLGRFISDATRVMSQGLLLIEDGRILLSNDALPAMLELPPEVLMPGAAWADLISHCAARGDFEGELADPSAEWDNFLLNDQAFSAGFLAAGKTWVHMEASPNGLGQWTIVLTDMTEMKQREEELKVALARSEAADRAKSDFLAVVSHEIRTPMNGVLGMAELLAKTDPDPRQKTFIDVMVKSGKALMTIINDILDFSTLEAGQLRLVSQHFDPLEAVEDVATLMSAAAFEKDLEIFLSSDDSLPSTLVGDAGRLRQILTNIVSNAIRFTEAGHVLIDLASRTDKDDPSCVTLVLTVRDSGIGIEADKLPTIFDKFHQLEAGNSARYEGIGLGLSVTATLVELFGGTISVESEPGVGSAFTVELPFAVASHRERVWALPVDLGGSSVLVIHSNPIGRELLSAKLSDWGCEAVVAQDAGMAMQILKAALEAGVKPAAIIVDERLDDMKGTAAVGIIHREICPHIPAVLLSSLDAAERGQPKTGTIADTYVVKPVRFGILRSTLIEVLRTAARMDGQRRDTFLPVPPVDGRARPRPAVGKTDAQRIDVLVAEDNEVNRIFFSQILLEAGLRFKMVENGADAVASWEALSPSLILMDVSMPVMDGFEAARMIRELEQERCDGAHVPIIGVTAHALEREREVCLHAGMDDHMAKPIVPSVLLDKIHALLSDVEGAGAGQSRP